MNTGNTKIPATEGYIPETTAARPLSIPAIFMRGLWSNNPGLCQLLGLCPLLAVTTSAVSALGLAAATLAVLCVSSVMVSLLRRIIFPEIRILLYVLLIATLVSIVRFYAKAWYPDLYSQLGIYLSLIVTNCVIMGRAEAFARKNNPVRALADALGCSLGFGLILFAAGSIREILGSGSWMNGAPELLGEWAAAFETTGIIAPDYTCLTAILPPGGFFVLALLIALKNALSMIGRSSRERRLRIHSSRK